MHRINIEPDALDIVFAEDKEDERRTHIFFYYIDTKKMQYKATIRTERVKIYLRELYETWSKSHPIPETISE